jgi:hypothetical protein
MWNPFEFIHKFFLWHHPPQQKPPGIDGVHYAIDPSTHRFVNVCSPEFFATLPPSEQNRAVYNNFEIEHPELPANSFLTTGTSEADVRANAGKDLQPDIESIRDLGPFPLDESLRLFAIVRKPIA